MTAFRRKPTLEREVDDLELRFAIAVALRVRGALRMLAENDMAAVLASALSSGDTTFLSTPANLTARQTAEATGEASAALCRCVAAQRPDGMLRVSDSRALEWRVISSVMNAVDSRSAPYSERADEAFVRLAWRWGQIAGVDDLRFVAALNAALSPFARSTAILADRVEKPLSRLSPEEILRGGSVEYDALTPLQRGSIRSAVHV